MNTMSIPNPGTALVPSDGYHSYLNYVRSLPILTEEEERSLFVKFKEQNDLEAARKLILSHMRFVVHIAKTYRGYGLPIEDIIQEGNVGLMKSVKRFDLNYGVRLSSFAVYWIKAEINEYVIKNWRMVKIATTKAKRKLFFNLKSMKKKLSWLSESETQDIAEHLDVTSQDVKDVETNMHYTDAFFDTSFGDSHHEEYQSGLTSAEALEDESQAPHLLLEYKQHRSAYRDQLKSALSTLDARSRDIVESRWLQAEAARPKLYELGERYGISSERVRQLEEKALRKLKGALQQAA